MSAETRLPEYVKLGEIFRRLRERMSPEVKQAIVTILDAVLDDKPLRGAVIDDSSLDPMTRLAQERNCRSTNVQGERCLRKGRHSGDHRSASGRTWHRAQRVTKKRKGKRR